MATPLLANYAVLELGGHAVHWVTIRATDELTKELSHYESMRRLDFSELALHTGCLAVFTPTDQ